MGTENQSTSADTTNSYGMAAQFAGVVGQTIGAYTKVSAENAAYQYQSKIAGDNARLAEWQAQDALQRGQVSQNNQNLKTAQLKGTQTASLAARGISLGEGSALNILTDTDFMGARDANTIHDNAIREAWGFRMQAANYAGNAAMLDARSKATSPLTAAATTLLTSGGRVASSWYAGKKTGLNADDSSTIDPYRP